MKARARRWLQILSYPGGWSVDFKSTYRSIWLGWWLITWCEGHDDDHLIAELSIAFQPGP